MAHVNDSATNLHDLAHQDLTQLVAAWGFSPLHAARIWRYLYRERIRSLDLAVELPARLRAKLADAAHLTSLEARHEAQAADGLAEMFLLAVQDGLEIETVLMRQGQRVTACLSSQAGCALGCVFCATGQQGFARNLTAGEIVAQALHVARHSPQPLRNIVLMGMGEPLQNYAAVMKAVDILRHPAGLAIAAKRITLSTVGVIPGIVRMAEERQPCSLAVSLHAATQEERACAASRRPHWPLADLIEACRYYTARLSRRIFFEWTLIQGRNDTAEHAHALAHLLQGLPAHVNLIPLNPTAGYEGLGTRPASVDRFQSILHGHDLPNTVRQRRGIDIAAGCGQLAGFTREPLRAR